MFKKTLILALMISFMAGTITFSKLLNKDIAKAETQINTSRNCTNVDAGTNNGGVNMPFPVKYSWVLNCGGGQEIPDGFAPQNYNFMQRHIAGFHVSNDGTTLASTGYDEGGRNLGTYKNGKAERQLGYNVGYGQFGGTSATSNSKYFYVAAVQACSGEDYNRRNNNGLEMFPVCPNMSNLSDPANEKEWQMVRRYDNNPGRGPARFSTGNGYWESSRIISKNSSSDGVVQGLFATETELFVSDNFNNKIKVFDSETMVLKREFNVPEPDEITMDKNGFLWVISQNNNSSDNAKILKYDINGVKQTEEIIGIEKSTALAVNSQNKLYIADNGVKQQIHIYSNLNSNPNKTGTFGDEFGIYGGTVPGKKESKKFINLQGVGFDAVDNIYIAQDNIGIQAFSPAGDSLWNIWGIGFVDTITGDRTDPNKLYSKDTIMQMDYSKNGLGSEQSFYAHTINPYKYPNDARIKHPTNPGATTHDLTSNWFVNKNGQKFMYLTDSYNSFLAGYRFNSGTDGEIAIPTMLYKKAQNVVVNGSNVQKPASLWVDQNGDGQMDNSEIQINNDPNIPNAIGNWALWVDQNGSIWANLYDVGVIEIPLGNIMPNGVPDYKLSGTIKYNVPVEFSEPGSLMERVIYDSSDDTIIFSGYNTANPYIGLWGGVGKLLVKYKNWKSGNPVKMFEILLPQDNTLPEQEKIYSKSITQEGDFIFIVEGRRLRTNVFNKNTGAFIGFLSPDDSQINPQLPFHTGQGWVDVASGISATKGANGEILVFVEDDLFSKVVMYRLSPPSQSSSSSSTTSSISVSSLSSVVSSSSPISSNSTPSSSISSSTVFSSNPVSSSSSLSISSSSAISSSTATTSTSTITTSPISSLSSTSTSTSTPSLIYEYKKLPDNFTNGTNLGSSTYNIANQSGTISGASDLSASVTPAWNNNGIFFEFNAIDNIISSNNAANAELQDGVEIMLDTNNSKGSNYDGVNDCKFSFTYSGVGNNVFNNGQGSNCSLVGANVIKTPTTDGYKMNIYIPFSSIGGNGIDNQIIGWDTQVNDSDDSVTRKGALTLNNPNLGNIWNTPSTWGIAKLLSLGVTTSSSSVSDDCVI